MLLVGAKQLTNRISDVLVLYHGRLYLGIMVIVGDGQNSISVLWSLFEHCTCEKTAACFLKIIHSQ